jgi:hypoxanthine-guanine phosphoribosyltransferase
MEDVWALDKENELQKDIQQVFLSQAALQKRVRELGQQISQDYRGKNPVLVGALKGVICFMADLLRNITIPIEMDFIAVSSYSPEARDQGLVRVVKTWTVRSRAACHLCGRRDRHRLDLKLPDE